MHEVGVAARDGNRLGEGVIWDDRRGRVMWTDIHGRRLWSLDPASGDKVGVELSERLACFAPLADGRLVAGFADGLYLFDPRSNQRTLLHAVEPELPTTRLNDGKVDRRGRLVFGTMDEADGGAAPIGQVRSYDGATPPRTLLGAVRISNSIAFSPDGRTMYFADTPERTIWAFDYDPDRGDVGQRRLFARTPGPGYPDGSCVDADGCLWNAEWDGSRIVRYAPDGRVDRAIPLPASRITCPAFGGAGLSTLFVTSATAGLDAAARAREPLAGALFAIDVGVRGLADAAFATETPR